LTTERVPQRFQRHDPRLCTGLIASDSGEASEWSMIEPALKEVPRPSVQDGPVAVAILCDLGEDFRSPEPPVPAAWAGMVRAEVTATLGV
jgi:hypothetical protein